MFYSQNIHPTQGNQDDQGNQGEDNNQGNQGNHPNYPNQDQNHHNKSIACPAKICEDIILSVPVEVRAHTDIKDITLKCGEHRIQHHQHDKPTKTHKFEIVKKISAQIPISFVAEVEIKDERVDFEVYECK